jgi:hypothetical protein
MGATSQLAEPGAIAQLAERLDRTQEVGGSNPPSSIGGIGCTSRDWVSAVVEPETQIALPLKQKLPEGAICGDCRDCP